MTAAHDQRAAAETVADPDTVAIAATVAGPETVAIAAIVAGSGSVSAETVATETVADTQTVVGAESVAAEQVWRPRPTTPKELDEARTVLVVHRLDLQTGRCGACAADCPCPPALDAGRVIAEAGAWNTIPFTGPTGRQADQAFATAEAGWAVRAIRSVGWNRLNRLIQLTRLARLVQR
jgi:hypothetical protein